ncbi:MAG: hypothetical protein NTW08_02405 [Gammaproteobacteria bacterium]|nr:hypothetical protein [Gammaproteobacteria bacterium]
MILKRKFHTGLIAILGLLFTSSAYSGFYANTAHSRANCYGFNESITWNWSEYHWWQVKSIHLALHGDGFNHEVNWPMSYTWRAAAYHANEWGGPMANNWHVQGYHWFMNHGGNVIYDTATEADDCKIYDGWWDKDKAKGELHHSTLAILIVEGDKG